VPNQIPQAVRRTTIAMVKIIPYETDAVDKKMMSMIAQMSTAE
jgi:hypothetical protein